MQYEKENKENGGCCNIYNDYGYVCSHDARTVLLADNKLGDTCCDVCSMGYKLLN